MVIVGARLAGCAVAAPLARAGRRVVVLDRMGFPSDQLSTHALMPAGTSELAKLGALPRILELKPSRVRWVRMVVEGISALERLRPAEDGIDYGVCVPRDLQDVQLVEAAREQGADVRERCAVQSLRWRAGRVAGVRYRDGDGAEQELSCTLLVGADGRRSTVAALVGAWTPYRVSRNGRGLVFRYLEDPLAGGIEAETYYQWREGDAFAFAFPSTPVGRLLVLFMGHRDEASDARTDPEGYWQSKLAEHPGLAARVAGTSAGTKLRSTGETPAFFRASSGPGWALAGDAGHFKDPVTGRACATRCSPGRTLAEHVLGGARRRRRRSTARLARGRRRAIASACRPITSPTPTRASSASRRSCASWCATPARTTATLTSPTCSAARARRSRSRRCRGSRVRSARRCGAASSRACRRCAGRCRTSAPSSRCAGAACRALPLDTRDRRLRAPRRDVAGAAEPRAGRPRTRP